MITVQPRQTLLDIAMQYLGDATRVVELANLNGIGITDTLTTGQQLQIPAPAINAVVSTIITVLARLGLAPASGDYTTQLPSGIGYWFIQQDFIVS